MNEIQRTMRSEYMEWTKLSSSARFNLATSGVPSVPRSEFPWPVTSLDVMGPGGYGYAPLRERIARHARVPEECVVASTGTSMANHLAMAAVLSPGDEVLIEQPAYGPLLDVANYLGARVKRIARRFEDGFAIDCDALERSVTAATRLIVLTNLHNPSGALVGAETLQEIAKRAMGVGARLLVDEVYLEMLCNGDAPRSFPLGQTLAGAGDNPFIVTSSLTKGYGLSGLRCGWIIAAPELARRISRLDDLFGAHAAHLAEQMSVIAFDHLAQFRTRAESLLGANRKLMIAFLDAHADFIDCVLPPAGSVFFPRLRHGDANTFAMLLRDKYETSVVPGSFFEMPRHFRLGISCATAELHAGLDRLGSALHEFAC